MNNFKTDLIKVSNEILDRLLEFRRQNKGFTFSLRDRNSPRSKEKRLENGQWFQGDNYIFIGLFSKTDKVRKVSTIGFVVDFANETIKDCHLTISFKGDLATKEELYFHKALAKALNIPLDKNHRGSFYDYANPKDYMANLYDHLNRVYPLAIKLLQNYGLIEEYVIKEDKFLRRLDRIESIRIRLHKN